MINLNNILVKSFAVLLVACIQTSCLLAMDSDSVSDKENGSKRRRLEADQLEVIDLTGSTIVMTVGDQTKFFSSIDKAHEWFLAMVRLRKAECLVRKTNKRTLKKNEEKKSS